jgi:chromosome segregation ATPase
VTAETLERIAELKEHISWDEEDLRDAQRGIKDACAEVNQLCQRIASLQLEAVHKLSQLAADRAELEMMLPLEVLTITEAPEGMAK